MSEGGPFFLTVDAYDPHAPWDPPEEYTHLYSDGYEGQEPFAPVYGPSDYLTEEQLKRMNVLYSAETTMMDRWLGHFLDKMEELNLFENTLVVLLSDHGILLGDHGSVGKPHSQLYPGLIDVPFLIRDPEGRAAGETSDYFASTHDVAPTILGFLGAEQPEQVAVRTSRSSLAAASPSKSATTSRWATTTTSGRATTATSGSATTTGHRPSSSTAWKIRR